MQPVEAILCRPGYRAEYVSLPATPEWLRKAVGGAYRVSPPFRNRRIALVCNARNYGIERFEEPGLRPNRVHPDDSDVIPVRFYYGNILLLGYGRKDERMLRSLTLKEATYVMDVFGAPDFPRPIILGLSPGEELDIISGIDFEGKPPDHAVVVREWELFITVRVFFHGWDMGRSYVTTLNKNSILCGDVVVTRKATLEDLRNAMLGGGAMNPADFVSMG
ncbi:MAG: hypothetical protein IIZ39_03550 [Blautia sp.]|nr:hypothetical protein [Blautia sp.]